MEINAEELAKTDSDLTDEELLRQHASGELTDIAYNILENELTNRGITIPERPVEAGIETGRPQSLRAHWEGQASLVSAYWLLWVLVPVVFVLLETVVFGSLFKYREIQDLQAIDGILYFVSLAYLVFAGVSVWRCAWNTSWKGWGYIARTIVVFPVVNLLIWSIILLINKV